MENQMDCKIELIILYLNEFEIGNTVDLTVPLKLY